MPAAIAPSENPEFLALYHRHRNAVVAYCARRAARAEALDAAADTFAIAWRRIDDLPGDDVALRWLYGIAQRVLANQRRSKNRLGRLRDKLLSDPTTSSRTSGPAETVERVETRRELLAAFARLREADQEVLRLVTWEELPRDQVAELLGVSRSTLDQRVHRATVRLRREYRRTRPATIGTAITGSTP